MQIIHPLNDFFSVIFPNLTGGGKEFIISELEKFYAYGPFKPKVTISEDVVIVDIDTPAIIDQEDDYRKTVALCEKGRYTEAKPILNRLLEKNPANSEYHRIRGQILSDEGNQEEAINSLIDALRWDSKNSWALLMLGNIFAKFRNDIDTAIKYYDQALIVKPDDFISLTNIGYLLLQNGKTADAIRFLESALRINPDFPNAHLTLSLAAQKSGDLQTAFNSAISALKLKTKVVQIKEQAKKQAFEIANQVIKTDAGKNVYRQYQVKLEDEGGTEIDIIEDNNIPYNAKIEFAENYNRQNHIVRYKPQQPAVEHLIMHELVHLDFVIQARKEEINQLFVSTGYHKSVFIKSIEPAVKNLKKLGYSESTIEKYCSGIFDGINSQIYNTPIDLFIENFLYAEFAELRPYQFLSLFSIINNGIYAVTEKNIVKLSPPDILSKSRILNLVNAFQFKELFGIDLTDKFKATQAETHRAKQFYNEYLEYIEDKEPAEEYELVQHWAEDLKLESYFELRSEVQYRKNKNTDSIFDSLQNDPLGMDDRDPGKERQMKKFQESQKTIGTNMAVVFFMVDALQFFKGMPTETIKKIAVEIALQGTQGYSPEKDDYTINLIPGKTFSGNHILAYFYVSWQIAMPESVNQLGLPFENEYEMAKQMHNQKQ
jgi:tetratricopeptide (TPR) repeat protein